MSGIHNTKYHNGSHLLLFGKRKLQSFEISQPAIAYSKLTIETLEQGVKYIQS